MSGKGHGTVNNAPSKKEKKFSRYGDKIIFVDVGFETGQVLGFREANMLSTLLGEY